MKDDVNGGNGPRDPSADYLDHDGRWGHLTGETELAQNPMRIRQIATSDAEHLPVIRDQRDGWQKMAELSADITAFLDDRIAARLGGNVAMSVYSLSDEAAKTRDSAELFGHAADLNMQAFDEIITQVTTLNNAVSDLDDERDLLPGSKPGEVKLGEDAEIRSGLDGEMREAMRTANLGYSGTYRRYAYKPPAYDGAPEWTGPEPRTPPGWGGGDVPGGGGSRPIAPDLRNPSPPEVIVDDGPGFGDRPDVIVDDGPGLGDGPDVIVDDGP
ncbi:MAG: hypothetical protein ACRD0P_38325, partial [Stackebrandtia sp.]